MPYVQRENGRVVGIFERYQAGLAEQFLADNHPDVVAFHNPPPTVDDVAAERERRLALGFDFNFGAPRGVHRIGTTEADMKGWDEVTKLKDALIQSDMPAQPIEISTNTGRVTITPMEWNAVLIAAAATFRQPIWQKSLDLQAMKPIPADFRDDKYWRD
jgi:hypothetical protein